MSARFYQVDSHPSHRVQGGTASDFNFPIVLPQVTAADRGKLRVVVMKASVPKSFYNVPVGRNTFTLRENGGADVTITVPVGTYNALDFKTVLQTLLNAARVGITYTVVFSTRTGKYTITCVGGTAVFVMPAAVGFGIHTIIGLDAGSTGALPLTSTNQVNFQLTSAVQLRSDMVSANDNVLATAYAAETEYAASIVHIEPAPDAVAKHLADSNNGNYRFYVTDVDGQALELNGGTVAFELKVYIPSDPATSADMKQLNDTLYTYMKLLKPQPLQVQEPDEKEVMALARRMRAQEPDEKDVMALAGKLRAAAEAQKAATATATATAAAPALTAAAPADAVQEAPLPAAQDIKAPAATQAALAGVVIPVDPIEPVTEIAADEQDRLPDVIADGDDDLVMVPDHFD